MTAAARLREAYATRTPCAPVRGEVADLDAAYRVQVENIEHSGARIVGRKIGLTSPAVQRQFGVFQPDFGTLLDTMIYTDTEPIALGRLLQPRVEAEIAFVLARDIDAAAPTALDVLAAVDCLLPAIEVVDSRIAGWDIRIVDTVADNASSGAVVVGTAPVRLSDVDMRLAGMVLEHRGEPVSVGAAAACLGSPLRALGWLASELARRGEPLRSGDLVLSGALGPMVSVTGPSVYEARIDGLGSVRAVFEEGT
ncbi:MAG TPA: fumarylacetoacetate hydrolase family protein [Micromonosporaceae bacterium]